VCGEGAGIEADGVLGWFEGRSCVFDHDVGFDWVPHGELLVGVAV